MSRIATVVALLVGVLFLMLAPAGKSEPEFSLGPEKIAEGQWRLRWTSVAGVEYRLERSLTLMAWDPVVTLTAQGPVTEFTDPAVPLGASKVFWRVVRLGGGDVVPPVVSILNVRRIDSDGQASLELMVKAEDNVAVVGVNFSESTVRLGAATAGPGGTWKRIVPLEPQSGDPRQFQAEASDAAGNVGLSEVFTFVPGIQSPYLLPLDDAGNVIANGVVGQRLDGRLYPFTWLPDGNGGGSPGHAFRIDFPEGGTMVEEGGRRFLEAGRFVLGFGPSSAAQLLLPDGSGGTSASELLDRGLEVVLPAGQLKRVPLGELPFATVADLLGLQPGEGVPLRVHGGAELVWRSGAMTRDGIRGGNFELRKPGLSLPDGLGGYERETVDLVSGGPVFVSVHGRVPLDQAGTALVVPKASPLTLSIAPGGEVSLKGAATLEMADGARFTVEVFLDDPAYCLSLRAGNLEFPLLDSLSDLLPDDPAACVPGGFDGAALDAATACLLAHERAYRLFLAAARAARPDDAADAALAAAPEPADLTGAALTAWAELRAVDLTSAVPLQPLREAVEQLSHQARGGADHPQEALAAVVVLRDLLGRLGPILSSEAPDMLTDAQAAIDASKPSLIKALEDPRVLSGETLAVLVQGLDLGNVTGDPELNQAVTRLLVRAVTREAVALGIEPGVFEPSGNPILSAKNSIEALAVLRRLVAIEEAGQRSSLTATVQGIPLYEETVEQVFAHAYQTALAAFDAALAARSPLEGMIHAAEVAEIQAQEALFGTPVAASPDSAGMEARVNLAQTLLIQALGFAEQADPLDPVTREQVFGFANRSRPLLDLADRLPAGESITATLSRLIFARLDELLPGAVNLITLADTSSDADLDALLEAGLLHAELKRRFPDLSGVFDWEGPPVGDVAARIADLAVQTGDGARLLALSRRLLDEADRLEREARAKPATATARRESRKRYLVVAAAVLADVHPLAVIDWGIAESRRAADPATHSVDSFLPGDLQVERVFGAACFNRLTGRLDGKLGGKLRLPKLDSLLDVHRASFDNRGRFDLRASGALRMPGAPGQPMVSLVVPASQPLEVELRPGRPVKVAGKARLEFDNGSFAAVALRFADPSYSLQVEAGGFDAGVRDALLAAGPVLTVADVPAGWVPFYEKFGSWMDGAEGSGEPAGGEPAEGFAGAAERERSFDASALLQAWAARAAAELEAGASAFPEAGEEDVRALLDSWSKGFEELGTFFTDAFTETPEERAEDVMKNLGEAGEFFRAFGTVLQLTALQGDGSRFNLANYRTAFNRTSGVGINAIIAVRSDPTLLKRPEIVTEVARGVLDIAAGRQLAGIDDLPDTNPVLSSANLIGLTRLMLAESLTLYRRQIGVETFGDPRLGNLNADEAEEALFTLIRFNGDNLIAGNTEGLNTRDLFFLGNRMMRAALEELEYQEDSGVINDKQSDDTLVTRVRQIHLAQTEVFPLAEEQTVPRNLAFTAFLLHKELLERAKDLPDDQWYARFKLLQAAERARGLRVIGGGAPLEDVDIERERQRLLRGFRAQGIGRLKEQEVEFLREVKGQVAEPDLNEVYRSRLIAAAATIALQTNAAWSPAQRPLGSVLAREIDLLAELDSPAVNLPADRTPAFLRARLTARVAEAAAGKVSSLMAALPDRFARAAEARRQEEIRQLQGETLAALADTLDPENAPVVVAPEYESAVEESAAGLMNAARTVLVEKAAAPRPATAPDLALPGDLRVDRIFGGFLYHRVTGFFQGRFGGKVVFPDARASFEIAEASFNSDGGFSISTVADTPVPVTGNDRARLTATLAIAGTNAGLQSVGGTGVLTLPFAPAAPGDPGTRSYSGSFEYDAAAPGKPLTFTAAVDGVQNEFKLGDDFAILNGQVALRFSTEAPDLTLMLGGKAGFFARPDAPPALGPDGKFWVLCEFDELELAADPDRLRAAFHGGTLKLAGDLFSDQGTGEQVRATFAGTLGVDFPFATGVPSFFGNDDNSPFRVEIGNLRFGVPGIADSSVLVETCALELFGDRFPVLTDLTAQFFFPLPGQNAANPAERVPQFQLEVEDWGVDGFLPESAVVSLTQDLTLLGLDGFAVDLVGGGANPARLGFEQVDDIGGRFTRMSLQGGMRVSFDSGLLAVKEGTTPSLLGGSADLSVSGGAMAVTAEGGFAWDFRPGALPALALDAVEIEGAFLLGNVLEITGVDTPLARMRVTGFDGFFRRDAANPFIIEFTAGVGVPEVGAFELKGARFAWLDAGSLVPEFRLEGFGLALGDAVSTILSEGMPLYVKEARLEFKDESRAIIPAAGNAGLFDPDNLTFRITAGAEFPPSGGGTPAEGPRFGGEVRDVVVSFPTGSLLEPKVGLSGIVMGIAGLDIPPLSGLSGQVALFNLDQLTDDPASVANVNFVGQLGGSFNGPGVNALLAASPLEFHGACIGVNAGVGIPLDGGVLGGILWTGAEGGIHFQNGFADPCEFESYVQFDGQGGLTGAGPFPEQGVNPLEDPLEEVEIATGEGDDESLYVKSNLPEANGQFDPFDCLRDNWPPRAANPLCEEFPAGSGRFVFKGSRFDTAGANQFLDTVLQLQPNDPRGADELIGDIIEGLAGDIRELAGAGVEDLLAQSGQPLAGDIAAYYHAVTERIMESFDDVARPLLRGVLQPVGGSAVPLRDRLFELLTGGIPCFNVTFLGSGTFTHTAVAPVMDVKGTVSVSTTGAALTRGELRLGGVPVAEASVGVSLTNQDGLISPFMGGLARVGVGPLEVGKVTMSAAMPGAANVVGFFDEFVSCSLGALQGAAAAQMKLILENSTGVAVPAGQSLDVFLLARSEPEKIAVMAALLDYFTKAADGTAGVALELRDGLLTCFADFMAATLNALTPDLCFGGKVAPSIFDLPLTTSGQPLASARMRYGPLSPLPAGDTGFLDALGQPVDLSTPGAVREFSAYMQFSPTALILSPVTALFTPAFPTLPGATAVDSAEFGFSFRQQAWTRERAVLFLTRPLDYYGQTSADFFNTLVMTAGYQLSPFGMKLADGQLRVVFPNDQLHPLRPGGNNAARRGNPIRPFGATGARTVALPAADEVILAALNAGRLKDSSWRGDPGQLADLFPLPQGPPAQDGCLAKSERVAAELHAMNPGLTLLAQKSFARDYFPYGGIIGGGQLAMPKLLTQGLPPRWSELFTDSGADWLDAFNSVSTFLGSSDCIGQLAFYIPAPNPVLLPGDAPDWSDLTVEKLLGRLTMDPAALVGRTINGDLYELDEIVMAGWADVDLLGVDLGEARIEYDNDLDDGDGLGLEAVARIAPDVPGDGNWFNDFFDGEARFEIALPAEQAAAGLTEYGFEQVAASVQGLLAGNPNPGPALVDEVQQRLSDAMPKVALEIEAGARVPAALSDVLSSSAGFGLSAFSPYYDPAFAPADFSPYAVARRQGGVVAHGSFQFGYFPDGAEPVVINVPDASLGFVIAPDLPFPALTGQLLVDEFDIPGGPAFRNGLLQFNSAPANGEPHLTVQGELEPLVFRAVDPLGGLTVDLLTVRPLPGATELGATFRVLRDDSVPGLAKSVSLSINPAEAFLPFLGEGNGAAVTMHNANDPDFGPFTPFTFSTASGQAWGAKLCLAQPGNPALPPVLRLRDPFGNSADTVVEIRPNGPLCAAVSGEGLSSFDVEIDLPTGVNFIFYPGKPTQVTYTLGGTSPVKLAFDSTGRFYLDFGQQSNVGLPGLINFNGRLEFGFNPAPVAGSFSVIPAAATNFGSVRACTTASVTRAFTLTNTTGLEQAVTVSASPPGDWILDQPGFTLANGQSRVIEVVFRPQRVGALSGTLNIETSDESIVRGLTGTGTGFPDFFASSPLVPFNDTLIGGEARSSVTIGNGGCADLRVTGITAPAGTFTRALVGGAIPSAGSPLVIPRGQSRQIDVGFIPTGAQLFTGSFVIQTSNGGRDAQGVPNGTPFNFTVGLRGTGSENRWLEILDSETTGTSASFNDILMLDAKRGWIAGGVAESGGFGFFGRSAGRSATLETKDGGRSWTPRVLTPNNIHRITAQNAFPNSQTTVELHFEEPRNSTVFRDDSGNGRNATRFGTPVNGFAEGIFGAGVDFDGVGDGLEFPSFNPGSSFTVSFWTRLDNAGGVPKFLGKTNTNGVISQFEVSLSAGQWRVRMDSATVTGGTATVGVHHVAVNVSGGNVTMWVDGVIVIDNAAVVTTRANWSGGNPWTVAFDYGTGNVASGFLDGAMDELMFFEPALAAADVVKLANGTTSGIKLLMAGDEGTLLESETRGRSWHLANDVNVSGWRLASRVFRDYDWYAATPDNLGRVMLAGNQPGAGAFNPPPDRALLIEGFALGGPGTADDRYGDASFQVAAGTGVGETLFDVITDNEGREFAFTSAGTVYQSPSGNSFSSWLRHGTLDLAGSLLDAEPYFSGSTEFYVAASSDGQIVRSANGVSPTAMTVPAGLPAIRQIDWNGLNVGVTPQLHAVGDANPVTGAATYLTSADLGTTWTAENVGLTGSWNGIDAREGSGSASNYESWVVGDGSRVAYHPPAVPNAGFLTFYPGELAFGFLQRGEAKTLPIRLSNRGRRALTLTGITVSGAGFELAQGLSSLNATLQPGDNVALQVRYKPVADSNSDLGQVVIAVTEGGVAKTFRAALSGRCDNQSWRVVPLAVGGVPVEGTVIDIRFMDTGLTTSRGYALVDSPAGGRFFRTSDGGSTWSEVVISPPAGEIFRFKAMDWHDRTTATNDDLGFIVGEARSAVDGTFLRGEVWRSLAAGASWFINRGPTDKSFTFRDIDILDTDSTIAMVVSGTESQLTLFGAPTGNVYVTNNATFSPPTWTAKSNQPSSSFRGSVAHLAPTIFGPVAMAVSASQVFADQTSTASWPGTPLFQSQNTLGDVLFRSLTALPNSLQYGWMVGSGGTYWRWERFGSEVTPFEGDSLWTPASNQEVFGTTNLSSVHFDKDQPAGFIGGGSRIFFSNDHGRSWDLDFDAGPQALVDAVTTVNVPDSQTTVNGIPVTIPGRTFGWAGGGLDGKAAVWKLNQGTAPARGVLSVNDLEVFAAVAPGSAPVQRAVTLRNLGNAPLPIHHIGLSDEDPSSRFRLLNDPPASIAAGGSFDLQVEFDPAADPVDLARLQPKAFFRFEQPAGSTTFVDSSAEGETFTAATPPPAVIFDPERRDSALSFGGSAFAEMAGAVEQFPGDFSFSIWINPATTADGQVFFSKHGPNGENRFLCQFLNNSYHFRLRGTSVNAGTGLKKTGWQHLAVTGRRVGTQTEITVRRDGVVLGAPTLIAALPGNMSGLPWMLGAERDGATPADINEFFTGRLDDFGIWDRLLDEGEIQMLASKSPACGLHEAFLKIRSGSDDAERRCYLRGEINETSGVIVIDTEPSGQPVRIDGVEYTTPATFAVRCDSRNPSEWVEGSLHQVSIVRPSFTAAAGGNQLNYEFVDWGVSREATTTVLAAPGDRVVTGRYVVAAVTDDAPPAGPVLDDPPQGGPLPLLSPAAAARIAGTPYGPWMRLSNGKVTMTSLSQSQFDIEADLFLSLTRLRGSVTTPAFSFPAGVPVAAVGAGEWRVDYRAGEDGSINLFSKPASIELMGLDVVPESEVRLSADLATGAGGFDVKLTDDFRPLPGFFEVQRVVPAGGGAAVAGISFERTAAGALSLAVDGRVRALRIADHPNPAQQVWGVDLGGSFAASVDSNLRFSLRELLGLPANAVYFSNGPFVIQGGDIQLQRIAQGLQLSLASPNFVLNGATVASLSGSVSTSGLLEMQGSTAANLRLVPNGALTLRSRDGAAIGFDFALFSQPQPGFRLELPPMRLFADLPAPADDLILNLPAVDFDSSGAFDTGKIALPSFTFDGIPIANQAGGSGSDNFIRLRRTAAGRASFTCAATLEPIPDCGIDFELSISQSGGGALNLDASVASDFGGLLPDPLSLGYDSSRACQFEALKAPFLVRFGSAAVSPFVCIEVVGGVDDAGAGGVLLLDVP